MLEMMAHEAERADRRELRASRRLERKMDTERMRSGVDGRGDREGEPRMEDLEEEKGQRSQSPSFSRQGSSRSDDMGRTSDDEAWGRGRTRTSSSLGRTSDDDDSLMTDDSELNLGDTDPEELLSDDDIDSPTTSNRASPTNVEDSDSVTRITGARGAGGEGDEGDGEETKASSADNASVPASPPAESHLVEFADYTSKQAAAAGMGNSTVTSRNGANAGANTPPTGSAKGGNIQTGLTVETPYSHDHDEEDEDDDDEFGGLIDDDLLRGAVEMQSPSAVDEPLSPFPNLVSASRALPGTRVASQAIPTKTKKKKNSIARSNTTPASHLESGQLKEIAMWDSEVNALKSSHEFQEVKASLQAAHSRVVRNKEGAGGGERRAERGRPHSSIT